MSAFKTLMNIIFPLITFPYASNVLQVENLGKVNFASSVCGYFLLFAGLGISSYAVREGSRYVNDREKLSAFASEMFSINMISTALTYAVLAVTMLFWTKLHAYTDLMLVLSLQIFFTTIWKNLCELAQHHISMICSHGQFHFLGHLRCDPVIRINKHHQFSTGSTQARISRIR